MIQGVAGTIIWTENFTELLDFYRNVFDFGETKFGLGIHKNVKGISKEIYRVMINLRTEDIFLNMKDFKLWV